MIWQSFVSIGDYGPYVWSAYALLLLAIGGEVVALILRRRRSARTPNA